MTLTVNQLANHSHSWKATDAGAQNRVPAGNALATPSGFLYTAAQDLAGLRTGTIQNTGGSRSHSNLMPFLCIHFIVALFGIYPSRP